jgi:hypothetical protein
MASGSIVGSYIGGRLLGLVPSVVTLPALAAILLSRLRPMTRGVVRGGPDVRPLPGFPGAGKGFLGGAGDLLAARRTAQTALARRAMVARYRAFIARRGVVCVCMAPVALIKTATPWPEPTNWPSGCWLAAM